MAGVGGAEHAEPGLGAGLEFVLDGGRTKPSAEPVRMFIVDEEMTVSRPFGLAVVTGSGCGTSAPAVASAAGFGVRAVGGGSEAGTVVLTLAANVWIFTADCGGCCCA